ncbi:MAG: transglycosylase SLT domain-containing protein [Elusimicrobiota bacterium]|nr:transglycosylase SLT domain-containing protein [Elusimicrobiota bacterium]
MKTCIFLAAALLAPLSASAQVAIDEAARAGLVQEIEAARSTLLPQAEPVPQVTVRFQPRLDDLKKSVVAAKAPAEFAKARKDFGDWKTVVIRHLHAESSRLPFAPTTFEKFSADKAMEINFVLGLRRQLAAQRVEAQVSAVRAASLRPDYSWSNAFDNASPTAPDSFAALSGGSAVVVPPPLPLNDPARYNKIRALLLSQGVSAQIVDTAIAEGRRQNVDPMIVLSVISQESNFRRNARNKGSGATGLMQLMPDTAAEMGVRGSLYDVSANIKAGTKYIDWIANSFFKMGQDLSDMSKIPADKLKMILASYNWGIGNVRRVVRKYGAAGLDRVAPKETRDYISEIPSRIYDWFASF